MAAPTTFDTGYPQNLWEQVSTKTVDFYVPTLYRTYSRQAVWNRFVQVRFNMNGLGAEKMYLDAILRPHANHSPIGARDRWINGSYFDTQRREITFENYAGGLPFHEYDSLINRYKLDNKRGLLDIITSDQGLAYMMTQTLDKLARDAFFSSPYAIYGSGSGTFFDTVTTSDVMSTDLLDDINLGMKYRDVPFAQTYDGSPGSIICLTTPGVIRDLKSEASTGSNVTKSWLDIMAYGDGVRLVNGEVGSYRGVRFVETNDAMLWNCGRIIAQASITAAIAAGDGAPNPATTKVDGTWLVGQTAATHSITVSSTAGFSVGDRVSLHVLRTNDFGVTNGADYRDGKFMTKVIVDIPDSTHLVFDEPVMEAFNAEVTSSVYGYVTLGTNIHGSVFLGANDGVAMGILESPQMYVNPPIDTLRSQWWAVWKARLGYQIYQPKGIEVVFSAGSVREKGSRYIR